MKNTFSIHWKASKQPRKQRKFRFNAPLHVRSNFLHAHLDKPLREKHGTRAVRVRTGDEVRIVRGQFSGRTGKVDRVDIANTKVYVLGIEQLRRDGSKKQYPMQPSNLLLIKLADDKRRFEKAAKDTPAKKLPKTASPSAKKTTAPASKAKEVKK